MAINVATLINVIFEWIKYAGQIDFRQRFHFYGATTRLFLILIVSGVGVAKDGFSEVFGVREDGPVLYTCLRSTVRRVVSCRQVEVEQSRSRQSSAIGK